MSPRVGCGVITLAQLGVLFVSDLTRVVLDKVSTLRVHLSYVH